jgi:hypothetical protein
MLGLPFPRGEYNCFRAGKNRVYAKIIFHHTCISIVWNSDGFVPIMVTKD